MLGVFAAFIFRVVFALITVQLLQYPILKIVGGALLIWIIFKLIQDLQLFDVFKITQIKSAPPIIFKMGHCRSWTVINAKTTLKIKAAQTPSIIIFFLSAEANDAAIRPIMIALSAAIIISISTIWINIKISVGTTLIL